MESSSSRWRLARLRQVNPDLAEAVEEGRLSLHAAMVDANLVGIRHRTTRSLGPLIRRRGFPKDLECPVCGRLRRATSPSDRMHESCRAHVSSVAMGADLRVLAGVELDA